jgi:hypothetical protein
MEGLEMQAHLAARGPRVKGRRHAITAWCDRPSDNPDLSQNTALIY